MTLARRLARYAHSLTFDRLPADVVCEHGAPRRAGCALCRHQPAQPNPPDGLDFAQRAAGEHLEHAS